MTTPPREAVPALLPTRLFVYTPELGLSDEDRDRLREAGFIPLCVADDSAYKIVTAPMPLPDAAMDAITIAALTALLDNAPDFTRDTFAKSLIAALLRATIKTEASRV